jgi:hypothetical protein
MSLGGPIVFIDDLSIAPTLIFGNSIVCDVSRVNELSGSVARYLSGRHSVPKGVRDEADGAVTGDPEDEIRRSV